MLWCLATPKLGDREVAAAMLEHAPLRAGLLIVADKGYASRDFEDFVRQLGATLVRPTAVASHPAMANWAGSG